jgi:hypothetical protein
MAINANNLPPVLIPVNLNLGPIEIQYPSDDFLIHLLDVNAEYDQLNTIEMKIK